MKTLILGNDGLFNNKYDSDLEDDAIDNDTSNVNHGSDSIDNLVLNVRDEASPTARGEYLHILLTKIACQILLRLSASLRR